MAATQTTLRWDCSSCQQCFSPALSRSARRVYAGPSYAAAFPITSRRSSAAARPRHRCWAAAHNIRTRAHLTACAQLRRLPRAPPHPGRRLARQPDLTVSNAACQEAGHEHARELPPRVASHSTQLATMARRQPAPPRPALCPTERTGSQRTRVLMPCWAFCCMPGSTQCGRTQHPSG